MHGGNPNSGAIVPSLVRRILPQLIPRLCASVPTVLGIHNGCPITRMSDQVDFDTVGLRRYQRQVDHVPNTQAASETHSVMAFYTDVKHHNIMPSSGKRFFPAQGNRLDAHVAIFRALLRSDIEGILKDLNVPDFEHP